VQGLSQIQTTFDATYGVQLRKSYHHDKCTPEFKTACSLYENRPTQDSRLTLFAHTKTGPAHDALAAILGSCNKKQKIVIAESYGGADEPVDTLAVRFAGLGLQEVVPALRVKNNPTEGVYQLFEESGTDLGQVLTKKDTLKAMKRFVFLAFPNPTHLRLMPRP
jgi:hypothetical protein